MDGARWARVKVLFAESVDLDPAARRELLDARCGDDPELRQRVEQLLAAGDAAGGFLEEPVLGGAVDIGRALDAAGPPVFAAGELIAGRYRIVSLLARGGMGEVYEAADETLGVRVALKTVRPELARSEAARERFRREMRLARRVTHPGICRIHDLAVHASPGGEAVLLLSMELLAGETLAERLRRTGRMGEDQALPLVRQMVDALLAAHEAGVIHRDFKSANVMLVPGPGGDRAVVMDFGVARATLADGVGDASLTATGALVGSPAYMAPEQVEGRALTPAADIYALGVVMYEMLTGRLPFVDDTPMSAAVRRLTEDPPPPRRHARGLSRRWEGVVLRCLERDPGDRFASVGDVARALAGEMDAASPRRRRRRYRVVAAGLVVALVAVLAVRMALRGRTPGSDDGELGTGRLVAGNLLIQRLTSTPEREEESSFAPDGRSIVHTVYEADGQQDLYRTPLGDGKRVRLTETPESEEDPHVSPDGGSIACTRRAADGGRPSVIVMPASGGDSTRVAEPGATPAWSPDGRELAFSRRSDDGTFTIARRAEGRATREVCRWPFEVRTLAWSPDGLTLAWSDGKRIVVASASGGEPRVIGDLADTRKVAWAPSGAALYCDAYWHGQGNLLRVPLDGGEPVQLTGGNDAFSPAVASDGRRIVYAQEAKQVAALLVDADGAKPRALTLATTIDRAAVDPSGTLAAVTNWVPGPGERTLDLVVLADGSHTPLAEGYSPAFSRDGRSLAFNDGERIHVRDLASGGDRAFDATRGFAFTFQPAFSPDGALLAFPHEGGPEGAGLSLLDLGSGRVTALGRGEFGAPAFSADGRTVAVSATIGGSSGLYLLEVASGEACRLSELRSYKAAPMWDGPGLALLVDERRAPAVVTLGRDGREVARLRLGVSIEPGFWGVFEAHPVRGRGWLLLQERYVGDLYLIQPPPGS